MSRRSHRHGERGSGRPPWLDAARPGAPGPGAGPSEAAAIPERPASVVVAPAVVPLDDVGVLEAGTGARPENAPVERRLDDQVTGPLTEPLPPPERTAPLLRSAERLPEPDRPPGTPPADAAPGGFGPPDPARAGCTSPQLRRFIKSRAYIPMHELRRRFAIDGPEDDVTGIDVDGTRLYVGLPEREGRLLAELMRGGDVGAELSHDPVTPVIVGVYPMRPVPRS